MKEIWKPIKGYEGFYEVSNLGRIKSLHRQGANERILKQFNNSHGYMIVSLHKDKTQKSYSVHKLVAYNFLSNTDNSRDINHIDGNKLNNCVNNLEFCSHSYNMKHAFKLGLNKGFLKSKNPRARKINQYDMNGNLIKTWNCILDAINECNISRSSIHRCCTGKYKQSNGYIWKYVD